MKSKNTKRAFLVRYNNSHLYKLQDLNDKLYNIIAKIINKYLNE